MTLNDWTSFGYFGVGEVDDLLILFFLFDFECECESGVGCVLYGGDSFFPLGIEGLSFDWDIKDKFLLETRPEGMWLLLIKGEGLWLWFFVCHLIAFFYIW